MRDGVSREQGERAFVEAMLLTERAYFDGIEQQLLSVEAEVLETERSLRALRNQGGATSARLAVGNAQTVLKRLQGRVGSLKNLQMKVRARQERELRSLYREALLVPRVLEVRVENGFFVVVTDVLYGKGRVNLFDLRTTARWHRVGAYKISWLLSDPCPSAIRWINMKGPRRYLYRDKDQLWHGPNNIGRDGTVTCLGSAENLLKRACEERDWLTLVKITVRYPECAGLYNALEFWPEVMECEVPSWYQETKFESPRAR